MACQIPSKYEKSTRTTSGAVAYAIVSVPDVFWSSETVPMAIVGGVLSTSIGATDVAFVSRNTFSTRARRVTPVASTPTVFHGNVPLGEDVFPRETQPAPALYSNETRTASALFV